jgi:hydrogenase maturation protein HypF
VRLSDVEARRLSSPARPIVLATKSDESQLAANVAPGLAELGVFLPYAPLHQLLLDGFGGPLVATSGNISGEPVLTDNAEAAGRLRFVADGFLHHDRPIVRPADDPVFRNVRGKARPIRAGRGTAPMELDLPWTLETPVLAVGAHMKGTVAIGWQNRVVVSPHIGEMDSPRSMAVFDTVVRDLQALYQVRAERVICDAHPGYATNRWAHRVSGLPVEETWHHDAHASALVAEHGGGGNWLVFTWDGVGLGPDGTLWGGEALAGQPGRWRRAASMRPFRLPGGDRAGREPWRSAAAICWETGRDAGLAVDGSNLARSAWEKGVNAPETTAVGRLFDAAAALVNGIGTVSYEAQGPMELESACRQPGRVVDCESVSDADGVLRTDWSPLIPMLTDDELSASARAESFHSSMARIVLDQAQSLARIGRIDRVGLTGGVFQNRVLTEQAARLLERHGFEVVLAEELPANDAAISFGQIAEVCARDNRGGN